MPQLFGSYPSPVVIIVPDRPLRGILPAEDVGYAAGLLWKKTVTPELLVGIVAVGGTLLGVLVGGTISHWSQKAHRKQERLDRHDERLRSAYATWAGALRRCVEAERLQLILAEGIQTRMTEIQSDKDVSLQMGMDMRDVVRAAIDAKTNEEIAFGRLLVTETNKVRVARTQRIRDMSPTTIALAAKGDAVETMASFEDAEPKQSTALSEFLRDIANELAPVKKDNH